LNKGRIEAFTDGVMAVALTVMVLEMKVPHGATLEALKPLWPVFLSYILSFAYIGIYWMNHHHLLQAAPRVTVRVLQANLNLLFWLSLIPFTTGWMGENQFARLPVILYGLNLLLAALSYNLLQSCIASAHDELHGFGDVLGRDAKGKGSILAYTLGIGAALAGYPTLGFVVFACLALVWLRPDRRMERLVGIKRPSE
jgi:uncharacterized membrane protein